jgi:glycerophosphoryl diester phosphodiesterase
MAPGYPENTLAAYRRSIALGYPAIEIDLRATSDGHIVVLHDDTVDRTTSGSGEVGRMTLAEVQSLDAGSHADPRFADQRIPTYQDVLETVRGTGTKLVLDIKPCDALDHERVVRLTEQHGAALDVIVGPRSLADLREFKGLNPNLRALGLVPGPEPGPPDPDLIMEFARAGADMIRLWPPWIFADRQGQHGKSPLIGRLHDLGKPVWCTADTLYQDISTEHPREDLSELVRLGVPSTTSTRRSPCCRARAAASPSSASKPAGVWAHSGSIPLGAWSPSSKRVTSCADRFCNAARTDRPPA